MSFCNVQNTSQLLSKKCHAVFGSETLMSVRYQVREHPPLGGQWASALRVSHWGV